MMKDEKVGEEICGKEGRHDFKSWSEVVEEELAERRNKDTNEAKSSQLAK